MKVTFRRWMSFAAKKQWSIKPQHGGGSSAYFSGKRSWSQKAAYCVISTRRHLGKDKTMETVRRSGVARDCGEQKAKERQSTEGFQGMAILCMILQWWIGVITHLTKPRKYTAPRVNSKFNCRPRVIMMSHRRFNFGRKDTVLGGGVDIGGDAHVGVENV